MGKTAIIFAGQGAQFTGMGKSLLEKPAARRIFEMCDELRPGTSSQCFEGTKEELSVTKNTQPCLFAVGLASAAALEDEGVRADMCAGFSLGEITACAYSGLLSYEDAFRLVIRRGELMDECAGKNPGSMAAVLKLDAAAVEGLCADFDRVYPVNYNCPGQIAVAGDASEMDSFIAEVKKAGGRAIKLAVSGAFHSPFMSGAAKSLKVCAENLVFRQPAIPLYSNLTGKPYSGDFAALLSGQIENPVRWEKLIRGMADDGADAFVECGAGKVLSGFIPRILPDGNARVCCAGELCDLEAALGILGTVRN